jgi:hypothetical protein
MDGAPLEEREIFFQHTRANSVIGTGALTQLEHFMTI